MIGVGFQPEVPRDFLKGPTKGYPLRPRPTHRLSSPGRLVLRPNGRCPGDPADSPACPAHTTGHDRSAGRPSPTFPQGRRTRSWGARGRFLRTCGRDPKVSSHDWEVWRPRFPPNPPGQGVTKLARLAWHRVPNAPNCPPSGLLIRRRHNASASIRPAMARKRRPKGYHSAPRFRATTNGISMIGSPA